MVQYLLYILCMCRSIIPVGPTRPHTIDPSYLLGRPVASQIGPDAIGPGPRPDSGRPIPILNFAILVEEFFYFYIIIFSIYQKYMLKFFLQKCHPAAGSSGGSYLPSDELAVGATAVLQPAIAAL